MAHGLGFELAGDTGDLEDEGPLLVRALVVGQKTAEVPDVERGTVQGLVDEFLALEDGVDALGPVQDHEAVFVADDTMGGERVALHHDVGNASRRGSGRVALKIPKTSLQGGKPRRLASPIRSGEDGDSVTRDREPLAPQAILGNRHLLDEHRGQSPFASFLIAVWIARTCS